MKMKSFNFAKGRVGEEIAKKYLIEKGMTWIESNFDCDIGEIDLIMNQGDRLVFVEVKYKSDDQLGIPEEMIGNFKINQVRRVAEIYLLKNPKIKRKYEKYRIDAVCILGNEVKHYENIGI